MAALVTPGMFKDLAAISARVEQTGNCDPEWLADRLADFCEKHHRRPIDRDRFMTEALPIKHGRRTSLDVTEVGRTTR